MLHLQIICGNNPYVFLKWRRIILICIKSSSFKLFLYSCILLLLWKNSQEWKEMDELWSGLHVCCKVLLWDGHRRASEYFNRTDLLPEYLHSCSCFPFKILTQEILFMCFEICFLLHPRSKALLGICWLKDCSNYFCCHKTVIDESASSSHTDSPQKITVHILIFEDILRVVFQA